MRETVKKIGQLFFIGFPGERPPKPFLEFLAEEQIGGIILFEENCRTHEVTRENIEIIKSQYGASSPLIAIDQEGGRVCRLRGAPAEYRAAADYGRNNELEQFKEDYTRSAVFMASIGINVNLGPVCDIQLNTTNRCLEDRCFGTSPETVTPFVEWAVQISKKAGVLSCLKHFPGLGAASLDPHKQTASADFDRIIWEQRERVPFAAGIGVGADMIMTTHIRLPKIDERMVTGSRKIVATMIRQELAFDGPVITDDLMMRGAEPLGHYGERAVAAFNAGHDILLFGQDWEEAVAAYDYFVDAVEGGEITAKRLELSLGRISGMKFKLDSLVLR